MKCETYKKRRDYTNEELITVLDSYATCPLIELIETHSEILRRMNKKSPLLPKEEEVDWGNPLVL